MTNKAWVITAQSFDENAVLSDPKWIENISARKKIGFIDDYLCDLFEDMLDETHLTECDDVLLRGKITHPSGTEVILEHAPFRLQAVLQEIAQ